MAQLKITYTKSSIGYAKDQKATVRSLGLRRLHQSVIQQDTPAIRGMAFKVRHLVTVEEVDGATPAAEQPAAQPGRPEAPRARRARAYATSNGEEQ
jgi:large subunit ribosomal protein L30